MIGGWYHHGGGVGPWLLMALLMLVFWAGLITLVILGIRRLTPRDHSAAPAPHDSAERILHERFARGEIDEQEYVARHTALRRTP